ncbi:hypothetical protein ABIE44_003558 [Marmoricola sp. OAE513]|uniref:hypothetical protein n=1 Tax=Marmoricola sp. OAE513 TaxID=2817894 RepID=UPI001AE69CAE
MGNVTLPTPVFVAGGALCLVAGYLIGTVAGPDTPNRSTATVASFDSRTSTLCLEGKGVEDEKAVNDDGELCGIWNHSAGATLPDKGDKFRFVSMDTSGVSGAEPESKVLIYGTVVK